MFGKIIRVNKIKYFLMYFNNEADMMLAVYKSGMEEELGKGLQIKSQDEIIGDNGEFKAIVRTKQSDGVPRPLNK
jgi:hypothetical protein